MKWIKKILLWFFGIIFALALIAVLFGGGSGDKNLSDSQNAPSRKAPVYICDVEGVGKVKGSIASNVGMAI